MNLLSHHVTERQLETALEDMASGYIFHGIRSVGKATAARELARRLNCRGDDIRLCNPCRQFNSGSYPDFLELGPENRPSITIEQIRQLNHSLSLSPYYAGGARVVLIDEAHMLTVEAQNALLKLIEEPPPHTLFVLAAEHLEALLPTVCSRLSAVYFAPVSDQHVADWLMATRSVGLADANRLAALAAGAPGQAIRLLQDAAASDQLAELDQAAQNALTSGLFDRLLLAKQLADKKVDLPAWSQRLQQTLLQALRQEQAPSSQIASRLEAVERFRRGLVANVGPRVALERLMLEL